MKLCIIGSSHTGSLKQGFEIVGPEFLGVSPVFFSSLGRSLRTLRVRNGTLVSNDPKVSRRLSVTSGGLDCIDPDVYDAFLIYGVDLKVPRIEQGTSAAVLRAAIESVVLASPTTAILERLGRITDKKIWISPSPLETTMDESSDCRAYCAFRRLTAIMAEMLSLPKNRFLGQPDSTVHPALWTLQEYGNWATRRTHVDSVTDGAPEADAKVRGELKHMNGAYGALWLKTNLPLIQTSAD